MLLWAFGFFIAAILAAFFALQEGSAFAGLAQILFWLLLPLVMMSLLKPLFRRRPNRLPPLSPIVTAPLRGGACIARTAVSPLLPTRPQHSPVGRTAAFLVNAAVALLLYAWINNDLKEHVYTQAPAPVIMEAADISIIPDDEFDASAASARKRTR